MRRSRVGLEDIADWSNLIAAFGRAALGKRGRADVEAYRANLDHELSALRDGLLSNAYPVGRMRAFQIHDPKPRLIHAPVFRERVLHHALMAKVGPVLDRTLVDDSFACRTGRGAHAAVRRAQTHLRRFPWFCQIDIRQFFPSIRHDRLTEQLQRKLSDHDVLALIDRILQGGARLPGRGLPIGALTSQSFASFHLGSLDRTILEHPDTHGFVRYMDDLVWWGSSRESVRRVLDLTTARTDALGLEVKRPVRIGRSIHGLTFCGYRILPDRLLLSRRRKQRYREGRAQIERAFAEGHLSSLELQRWYDAVLAITKPSDATAWRRHELHRRPIASTLEEA